MGVIRHLSAGFVYRKCWPGGRGDGATPSKAESFSNWQGPPITVSWAVSWVGQVESSGWNHGADPEFISEPRPMTNWNQERSNCIFSIFFPSHRICGKLRSACVPCHVELCCVRQGLSGIRVFRRSGHCIATQAHKMPDNIVELRDGSTTWYYPVISVSHRLLQSSAVEQCT